MSLRRVVLLSSRCLHGKIFSPATLGRCYQTSCNGTFQSFNLGRQALSKSQPSYVKLARYFSSIPPYVVVKLPNLSPTMETGNVVSWAKNVGDQVVEGDLLAEIETDKATMAMEASDEGYIAKILIPAGTKNVPIGSPLVIIVENKSSIEAFKDFQPPAVTTPPPSEESKPTASPATSAPTPPPPSPPPPTPPPPTPPPPTPSPPPPPPPQPTPSPPRAVPVKSPAGAGSRLFISPLARRVATERGIDLSLLRGTGSGVDGCFVLADLDNILVSAPTAASYADIPVTGMRSVIAKRLIESKRTIPHYYLTVEVELDAVIAIRESMNASLAKQAVPGEKPAKVSVNDVFIKAMALASKAVPDCNASWMGDFIRRYHSVDVSVAVATPDGLITPIIFNADSKGILTINQEVRALAAKAKDNKLKPEEFQGGTITISNLGMFGVASFSAIINPPQACILSVGGSQQVLIPDKEKGYKTVTKVAVTLCCDHRVVDGAVGARWLQEFKGIVETPARMLL